MADGLAGHEKDFYSFVNDSSWLGGKSEYSNLNEGFPYWFNGAVPLAYGLNDTRLIGQVHDSIDYVLVHQQPDGWLGPETTNATRDLWARFPLFLGFTQVMEAEQSQSQRLLPAMYKFINLMHSMLVANQGFIDYWGKVRYQDMLISLQWLHEHAPSNDSQLLLDTMDLLRQRGRDWADYYQRGTYIFKDLDLVQPPIGGDSPMYPWVHGVNVAQSLKAGAVIYRYTQNETQLQSTRDAVNWTLTYHGDVAGSVIGDERESNLSPNRGSELCTAVEIMYSLSYLYHVLGDKVFADRCELAAFNVLPAMLMSDQGARQYLTLANQPFSESIQGSNPWNNVGADGIIYGLAPNYPCCTVNHPQGLPKFLSASFVRVGVNGIGHALLTPATMKSTTQYGVQVQIVCNTKYPFENSLHYSITASKPFDLSLRFPDGYDPSSSSITVNGVAKAVSPDPHTGMTVVSIEAGTSSLCYELQSASIRVVPRANSSVAIYHGSLLYALDVGQSVTTLNPSARLMAREALPPIEFEPHDYRITNLGPWNMAIDTSTLEYHSGSDNSSADSSLPSPLWTPGGPPNSITARGCQIEWPVDRGVPAPVPLLVNGSRKCTGPAVNVTLRPFGSLKIHMAELPTVDLGTNGTVS
ncbi:MAG: hypothetical protein Q9191_000272 [Dirinaria sp. TL-2023a]